MEQTFGFDTRPEEFVRKQWGLGYAVWVSSPQQAEMGAHFALNNVEHAAAVISLVGTAKVQQNANTKMVFSADSA